MMDFGIERCRIIVMSNGLPVYELFMRDGSFWHMDPWGNLERWG